VSLWQDFLNNSILKSCQYGKTFLVMKLSHYRTTLIILVINLSEVISVWYDFMKDIEVFSVWDDFSSN